MRAERPSQVRSALPSGACSLVGHALSREDRQRLRELSSCIAPRSMMSLTSSFVGERLELWLADKLAGLT
jgi:hypothetical protein